MPRIHNVEVYVETDGGRLQEYNDPDFEQDPLLMDSPTKVVYIESQERQEFRIVVTVHDGSRLNEVTNLTSVIKLDGQQVPGFLPSLTIVRFPATRTILGAETRSLSNPTAMEVQKFTFEKLPLTESKEDAAKDGPKPQDIGEIKVQLKRYIPTGVTMDSRVNSTTLEKKKLHEKQLKGRDIAHTAGLGKTTILPFSGTLKGHHIDDGDNSFMIFRFRYRSNHALKSLGLIPQTPSPPGSPVPRASPSAAELSREELIAEVERLRNLNGAVAGVKRERSPSIKPERSSQTKTQKKRKKVETIDLTEDD